MPLTEQEMYEMGKSLARKNSPARVAIDVGSLDVKRIESQLNEITDAVDNKGIVNALLNLTEAFDDIDMSDIVAAISAIKLTSVHNEVDSRPELGRIASELAKIAVSIDKSREVTQQLVASVNKQNDILAREKKAVYDASGRITGIK